MNEEEITALAKQIKKTSLGPSKHPQEVLKGLSFFLEDYEEYIHRGSYWEEAGGLAIHIRLPRPAFSLGSGRNFERVSLTLSRQGAVIAGISDADDIYEDMLTWSPDPCPVNRILAVIVADMLRISVKLFYDPRSTSGVVVWNTAWNHGKRGTEILAECLIEDYEILFVRSRYDFFSISRRGILHLPAPGKLCYEIRQQE